MVDKNRRRMCVFCKIHPRIIEIVQSWDDYELIRFITWLEENRDSDSKPWNDYEQFP